MSLDNYSTADLIVLAVCCLWVLTGPVVGFLIWRETERGAK